MCRIHLSAALCLRYWCPRKLLYVCEIGKYTNIMNILLNGFMARRRRFRILLTEIIVASSPKPMGCKVLWLGRTCIFLVGVSWLILWLGEMDRACSLGLALPDETSDLLVRACNQHTARARNRAALSTQMSTSILRPTPMPIRNVHNEWRTNLHNINISYCRLRSELLDMLIAFCI